MTKTVNFQQLPKDLASERRKQIIIIIFHSMPCNTDGQHAIDEQSLIDEFWPKFVSNGGIAFAVLCRRIQDRCGYPWKSNIGEKNGERWAEILMYAALLLDGFVSKENGMGDPATRDHFSKKKWVRMVRQELKEVSADDWLPTHDRRYLAAVRMAGYKGPDALVESAIKDLGDAE